MSNSETFPQFQPQPPMFETPVETAQPARDAPKQGRRGPRKVADATPPKKRGRPKGSPNKGPASPSPDRHRVGLAIPLSTAATALAGLDSAETSLVVQVADAINALPPQSRTSVATALGKLFAA